MTKFAIFSEDGLPITFYAEDVHGARVRPVYGEVPEPTEEEPNPPPLVIGHEPSPDTLIPLDAVEITDAQWLEFLCNQGRRRWQGGEVVSFEPPVALPTEDDYRLAIQNLIDGHAQSRRYDSGNSLATYVASSNPDWAAEAQAFVLWRDAVWAYAYVELDNVLAGEREQPSVEAFIGEFPEMMWPAQ